jgi:beta-lactamase class A
MSIYWPRTKRETRSGAYVRHASATKTATMEAAASEVSPAAKSTSTVTASAAAARIRPRGQSEGEQTEANNAKYSFCFHALSSRQPLVTAIAHPLDFRILPKTY